MAVTLTGAKYASATLSAVGTTTITTGSALFSSGDFSVQRVVGLWDSTGATFKGMAYVRRYLSTTQLELEKEFLDPVDGSTVTQVTGDIFLVSKNWADVATTGIAVSGNVVTLTDDIVFGTASDPDSLCFYDERKYILTNRPNAFDLQGGLIVHGHLQDYSARTITGDCHIHTTAAHGSTDVFVQTNNTSAHWMFYGGALTSDNAPIYYGGYLGSAAGTFITSKTYCAVDLLSVGAGGAWGSNSERHILDQIFAESTVNLAILARWGDGVINGGSFKIPQNSSAPLAIFGGASGEYTIGAPAGESLIVSDIGNGNYLWFVGISNPTTTVDFTNVITTDKRATAGTGGAAATNSTLNFYYESAITNLIPGSTLVIELDADNSTVDSVASSGTSENLTLLHEQYIGTTKQFERGPWTLGVKKYGYNVVSSAITQGSYDLGTAGIADNIDFNQAVIQVADSNVTLSEVAADALTTVDDCDEFYDAFISWSVASVSNAVYPSVSAYGVTSSGTTLDFGSKDITFNTGAGSVLAVNTGTDLITVKPTSGVNAATKFDTIKTTGAITGFTGTAKIDSATLDFPTATSYTGTYIGITADFSATGTFDLTGATLSGTIELTNSSGGAVTVQLPTGTSYTNTGPNITVDITVPSLSVSVTGMPNAVGANNRLQIINTTALSASAWQATTAYALGDIVLRSTGVGTENTAGLFFRCTTAGTSGGTEPTWVTTTPGVFGTTGSETTDGTVTWECFAILAYDADPGASLSTSYFDGNEFAEGEGYTLRFAEEDPASTFKTYSTSGLATASGISALVSVEADSVYATNAISGASRTEFTADYTDNEIDVSSDTDSSPENAYAWYCYNLTTSEGMYKFWGAVTAIDAGNYRNNVSVASIKFDNTTTGSVSLQGSGARFFRSDGANPEKIPTTSGFGVSISWELPVYAYDGGGGGFTSADRTTLNAAATAAAVSTVDSNVDAIKTKTDQLTFTVVGQVDANCESMNAHALQGDGSESDKIRTINAP